MPYRKRARPRWGARSSMGVVALALGGALAVRAQEGTPAAPRSPMPTPSEGTIKRNIAAVRLATPPTIDGDLSDPAWQQAAKAERFVDWLNTNPNIDQTVVYAGYDDRNIYLGWHAYDGQPRRIVARQTKRGAFPDGDDWVDLNLDPYHTHNYRDYAFFFLNPIGTRYARLPGGRATKLEWEGDWQSAAKIVADGWTAEMAIPWAILSYPAVKGPRECGINFLRFQKRTNILSNWSNIGPNDQHPEFTGHWIGVEYPPFRAQFSLLPYSSSGWGEEEGTALRTGLDLRSRLTPTLNLVGTVNPDFRNVEGAVEGIDFSYGPRFVPDRRPFFQEGFRIYDSRGVAGRYFYSSRVGAFDVGANLYGKLTPRDTLGLLAAVDLGRRTDWVVRGLHQLGPTSDVSFGLINRDDERGSNRVLQLAEGFRRGHWTLDGRWAGSWVDDHSTGDVAEATLRYESRRWFASLAPHYVRPDFRDDLGFIPFTDFKGVNSSVSFQQEWRRGPLRTFVTSFNTSDTHHYDGRLFRQQRNAAVYLESRSGHAVELGWDGGRFEEFDDRVFRIALRAHVSDPFHNYGLGYSWGRQAGDPITYLTHSVTWRFGEKLTLGLTSAILRHTEDAEQHVFTFNYDLSPERGIGGRLVAQTGGTNGYLAYRKSGYGGVERFLILGDPNAAKFKPRIALKVVWPM